MKPDKFDIAGFKLAIQVPAIQSITLQQVCTTSIYDHFECHPAQREQHGCLERGHGVEHHDKVIDCLGLGLGDGVVRFHKYQVLRTLQTQVGTGLDVHLTP